MPTIGELKQEIIDKQIELESLFEVAKQVFLAEYFTAVTVIESDGLTSDKAQSALQDALQVYINAINDVE